MRPRREAAGGGGGEFGLILKNKTGRRRSGGGTIVKRLYDLYQFSGDDLRFRRFLRHPNF